MSSTKSFQEIMTEKHIANSALINCPKCSTVQYRFNSIEEMFCYKCGVSFDANTRKIIPEKPIEVFTIVNFNTSEVYTTASKGSKPIDILTRVKTIIPEEHISLKKPKTKKRVIDLTKTDNNDNILLFEDQTELATYKPSAKKRKTVTLPTTGICCKYRTPTGKRCWFKICDNNDNEFCPTHQSKYLKELEKEMIKKQKEVERHQKFLLKEKLENEKKERKVDSHKALCDALYVTQCRHIHNDGARCKSKIPIEQDLCKVHEAVKIRELKKLLRCQHWDNDFQKCYKPKVYGDKFCKDHRVDPSIQLLATKCKCPTTSPCSCRRTKQ